MLLHKVILCCEKLSCMRSQVFLSLMWKTKVAKTLLFKIVCNNNIQFQLILLVGTAIGI